MTSLVQPIARNSNVFISRKEELRWIEASRPGLRLAAIHEDRASGKFLGLLGFEPLAASGLHHHIDIAFSYFLSGGLTDYSGTTVERQMGINMPGATHDAIAYMPTLMASRLDGPVLYGRDAAYEDAPHLHAGARVESFVNPRPEESPDVNISVEMLPATSTAVAGVSRRLICDYKGTTHDFRNTALTLIPGAKVPPFTSCAPIEIFVIAGGFKINGSLALGGGFCVIEPGTQVQLSSDFGAFLLVWSEAPIQWQDQARTDLFGF